MSFRVHCKNLGKFWDGYSILHTFLYNQSITAYGKESRKSE